MSTQRITAKRLREAGEGALRYALKNGGWTEEQIENGLKTHWDSIAHELAERVRAEFPDPNPLASVFKPYIGDRIAEFVERGGKR